MTGEVIVERDGEVVTITLSNPGRRNAISLDMYDVVERECIAVNEDSSVRALVLRGADGAFAGGTDISHFAGFASGEDGVAYEARISQVLSAIRHVQVPVISVVDGPCVGGGFVIAALSDLVLCTPGARFGSPIAYTIGNSIAPTSIARLWWHLGRRLTSEVLITGRLLTADEALAAGFVNAVLDPAGLEMRLADILAKIATAAPASLRSFKEFERRIDASLATIVSDDVFDEVYGSGDFHEGVTAFLQRRPPQYSGT
ncbi:enoyl-CoA hydratase-related protein [Mycetocola miduiensis]|uniref:Enoyl-CoA hydratase/carnithine racemase n=1 Tax=Mycetocola miduiensis TaxID=995034 RepID=A0A1I5AHF6_9MICO|nr:enoyl-CoA hydratase-related protein [Mycetocola miduiensis]SFN61800.1 Enoyl-CoA hydratase/carnithine racemase [Mycetocola miduiensis]